MDRLVVISPAPTANGDLHLGHLAGPFLAADVCTRYARATGREALYGTGMHFTQNYVVAAAERLGVAPEDLRERSAEQVRRTFAAMGVEIDGFGCLGDRFTALVTGFYERLHGRGLLELRTVSFPYLRSTGEYLMDAYVTGGCPFCLAHGCAGICESCGLPIAPGDLLDPRSTTRPDEPLERREVDILVFPVERYRAELEAYFARAPMRPGMARLIESALARPLPDFPITQPASWGIPAPFPEVAGQVFYAHMEGMPWSMFTTALGAEERGAVLTADDELWRTGAGTTVVYFLGLDATYPFAIVGTALLTALGEHVLPSQYLTNEFYELANEKFSTSRGHVVSGRELAAEVPRDLIRFHLCATSPEYQRTDFTREAMLRIGETRLTAPWNRVAAAVDRWVDRGPLPVSANARHTARRMAERFADTYELPRFSLTAAASTLAEQLGRLDRLATATTFETAGDLCHQVEVFLRCAAPILIDLAAAALPDTTLPGHLNADTVTPKRLPRLSVTVQAAGSVGAAGSAGSPGATGVAGSVSAAGLPGSPGATDFAGPARAAGATGSAEAAESPAIAGAAGMPSTAGSANVAGAPSMAWSAGATGSAGTACVASGARSTGAPGTTGAAGSAGAAESPAITRAAGAPSTAGPAGVAGAPSLAESAGSPGSARAAGTAGVISGAKSTGAPRATGATGSAEAAEAPVIAGSAGVPGAPSVAESASAAEATRSAGVTGPAGVARARTATGLAGPAGASAR